MKQNGNVKIVKQEMLKQVQHDNKDNVQHDSIQFWCHPEFIWQSEQTKDEFSEPAPRVTGSDQRIIMKQNENNTVVRYKIPKQVRNDMKNQVRNDSKDQVQHDKCDDKCHPEFISGSNSWRMYNISVNMLKIFKTLKVGKIPKQVRNDIGKKISEKVVKQVRNDNKDRVRNDKIYKKERNSKMNIIKKIQKAVAFTLAETLVVMGIIGVVAALTIPNLNQSTGDREKVAKLKKVYANLTDAYGRMEAVYGPFEEKYNNFLNSNPDDELEINSILGNRLTEFMKLSKNCERNRDQGCFISVDDDDGGNGFLDEGAYTFVMADGTAVWLNLIYGGSIFLQVDLNGPNKGQHLENKDIFMFIIDSHYFDGGIMPLDLNSEMGGNDSSLACAKGTGPCTNWVIQNGNMDYLKADKDGKCPNGTQLSATVTSCK